MTPPIRDLLQRCRAILVERGGRAALVVEVLVVDIDAALAGKRSVADRIVDLLAVPMTTTEIRAALGISPSHAWNELRRLEGAGVVRNIGARVGPKNASRGRPKVLVWARCSS